MNNDMIKGFVRTHITMDLRRHADGTFMSDDTASAFNTYRAGWLDGAGELAEARKDQARYQWIRNESWAMYNYNKGKPHLVTFDSLQRPTHLAENAVDQAIDAAIKEQGK